MRPRGHQRRPLTPWCAGWRLIFLVSSVDSQSTAGGDNVLNRRAIKQSPTATIETTFGYDDEGRVTSETGPGARHVTQTWDRFGQLKTRTDSRGVNESWDYDPTTGFLRSYTDPKNTITTSLRTRYIWVYR